MSDPDRDRSIRRMSMIAFFLAALAGLLAILLGRPTPVDDTPPKVTSPR
jgi:hypothetical protein